MRCDGGVEAIEVGGEFGVEAEIEGVEVEPVAVNVKGAAAEGSASFEEVDQGYSLSLPLLLVVPPAPTPGGSWMDRR